MTSQHTPGPWVFDEVTGGICGGEDGRSTVAVVDFCDVTLEEERASAANARLIAAAPDLLQACEQAEYWLAEERRNPGQAEPSMILRVLRAAIVKAGGEPVEGGENA